MSVKLDRRKQSIDLLRLLGDDIVEGVLAALNPDQARQMREMLQDGVGQNVSLRRQLRILDEFEAFQEFARRTGGLPLFRKKKAEETEEVPDTLPLNADGTPEAGEAAEAEPEEERIPRPELTGNALKDLERLSVYQVAGALDHEQIKTTAILMSALPAELAAGILAELSEEHRNAVVKVLSQELHAPAVLVERIARATLQRALALPPAPPDRRDHIDRLAEVLRSVPKGPRQSMLADIEAEDEELAALIIKRLYRFEDFCRLDSRVVQRILGEVDGPTLTTALFQADQAIIDLVFSNLSRRARIAIEEELQFQTYVPDSRLKEARETIGELMAKIDQEAE